MNMESIPINLIRQWHFCPRIPFYQETLNTHISRPIWVRQGNTYEKMQHHLMKRRNLSRFQLERGAVHTRVHLNNAGNLPFHGIADSIIETEDSVYIVEMKINLNPKHKGIRAQIAALAMLASRIFNKPSPHGFIVYGKKANVCIVDITDALKNQTLETAHTILNSLKMSIKPSSSASLAQCSHCEYLNYCNDRM